MKTKNKIAASNSGTVKNAPSNKRKTCVYCRVFISAGKMDELTIRRECLTRFCEGRRITIDALNNRKDCCGFDVLIFGESPELLKRSYKSFTEFCAACSITVYVCSKMVVCIANDSTQWARA